MRRPGLLRPNHQSTFDALQAFHDTTVRDIFLLFNKQFFWLSVVAFVLATFPAWYAMTKWLDSFQFKIEISWVSFGLSMGASLFVVLVTVGHYTVKAIRVNPAETLKYE